MQPPWARQLASTVEAGHGMHVTLREEDASLRENLALGLLPWSIMFPKVA